jgi:hypothetical protein
MRTRLKASFAAISILYAIEAILSHALQLFAHPNATK